MQPNQQDQLFQPQVQPNAPLPYFLADQPQTPPPTNKPRKWLKMVLIVGVPALIGLCSLVAILSISSKDASPDSAVAFVEALKTGKYADAYNFLSPQLMEQQSIKQFTAQFRADGVLLNGDCLLENIVSKQVDQGDEHTGLIRCANKSYRAQFIFVDSDGEMKLVRYLMQPQET